MTMYTYFSLFSIDLETFHTMCSCRYMKCTQGGYLGIFLSA